MIQLKDVSYRVGDFRLRNVSMTIADGNYFVLLGPAGLISYLFNYNLSLCF